MKHGRVSFKGLFEDARKRHGYWLARMELDICLRVHKSKYLKHHWKAIGKLVEDSYATIHNEAERYERRIRKWEGK